jgi:hypothetical protein
MLKRVVVCGLFLIPGVVQAWTPSGEQRIAQKSAALAPADLKILIDKYSAEYARGVALAAADEGSEAHRFIVASGSGRLQQQINQEVATIIRLFRTRQPIGDAVERLGRLVHYVSDANNPLHVADDYPSLRPKQQDFELFFDRKLEKFPTVFYGLTWPLNPSRYLAETFSRTAELYPLVYEEYFRHGEEHSGTDFDDRSTAFGVASVAYSHAVTDVVNLYYYIWKESGGDVRTAAAMSKGNLLLTADPRSPFASALPGAIPDRQRPSGNR